MRGTSLYRAAWQSLDVLLALFQEGGLFAQCKSYRNPSMGFAPLWGWDGVFDANQVGSQGGVGLVGNLQR